MSAILAQPHQYLPQPSAEDERRIRTSILDYGGLWPGYEIDVDENGDILDGNTRDRICRELGLPAPRRVRTDLKTPDEKFDFVVKVNMARRHLTIDQKRDLTMKYLHRFPEKSNRSIAAVVGLDDKTVGVVRHEAETSAEIPQTVRAHQRPDQERDFDQEQPTEPIYRPDHKDSTIVQIRVNYPLPSGEERTRHGLPYLKEAERREWQSDPIIMQTAVPTYLLEAEGFALEMARRFMRELQQKPFLTMRREA